MKRICRGLLSLFLAVCARVVADGSDPSVEKIYVTGPRSASVPLELSPSGQLFVNIHISGRKLKMLVDTGGANTSVDRQLAVELGLKAEGKERGVAVAGKVVGDFGSHADIVLSELLIHRTPVRLLDLADTRRAIKEAGFDDFDGIIGVDMLIFLRAMIDFDGRR